MTIRGQSSVGTKQRKVENAIGFDHECEEGVKRHARACGAKNPGAEACDLSRGHRGPHSWSWMRKLNQPIKRSSHLGRRGAK